MNEQFDPNKHEQVAGGGFVEKSAADLAIEAKKESKRASDYTSYIEIKISKIGEPLRKGGRESPLDILQRAATEENKAIDEAAEKERVAAYVGDAYELSQRKEALPFLGMEPAAYAAMKAEEVEIGVFTTPIDEIVARLQAEGYKIVPSPKHPNSGNVFVMPFTSPASDDDVGMDGIPVKHLRVADDMDDTLKRLILANKRIIIP